MWQYRKIEWSSCRLGLWAVWWSSLAILSSSQIACSEPSCDESELYERFKACGLMPSPPDRLPRCTSARALFVACELSCIEPVQCMLDATGSDAKGVNKMVACQTYCEQFVLVQESEGSTQ